MDNTIRIREGWKGLDDIIDMLVAFKEELDKNIGSLEDELSEANKRIEELESENSDLQEQINELGG